MDDHQERELFAAHFAEVAEPLKSISRKEAVEIAWRSNIGAMWRAARRSSPSTQRQGEESAVAWAVTAPRGGIHKLSITRESAERKMAKWLDEWPDNKPRVRPLVFGDAEDATC